VTVSSPAHVAELPARATAITSRTLLTAIVPAIVVLDVFNAAAIALHHYGRGPRFFAEFSLDREANVPTWFSSVLLLTAAVVLGLAALDAASRRDRWTRHWTGLAWVYGLLSLDETAQLHERSGSWLRAHFHLHGLLHYAGIIPALGVAVVVGVAYFRFLLALPQTTRRGIVFAAAVYIFGAAGLEAVAGWWSEGKAADSTPLLILSTVEENLELIGTTFFILTVLAYLARSGRAVSLRAES